MRQRRQLGKLEAIRKMVVLRSRGNYWQKACHSASGFYVR